MVTKNKIKLQDFNAKAFEIKHSGELPLGIIPAGKIGRGRGATEQNKRGGNESIWRAGETKSGASKFKIFLGVQQIGTMYQITPDRFSAMLSYEFGGDTKEFEDPKLATDWLVDRYFDWVNGEVRILDMEFGYEISHDRICIGFVNYSSLYEKWVAISYPDRCSCFSITEHHGGFSDAVQFIINKYLSPHSDLELKELTTK